jgi:hypothetical protein
MSRKEMLVERSTKKSPFYNLDIECGIIIPQSIEEVRKVLLGDFVVNVFKSLLLIGEIELVESNEVGI